MHFVSLRFRKPLTPGQRWRRDLLNTKNFTLPTLKHNIRTNWLSGRTQNGQKTIRTKSKLLYKKKTIVSATLLKFNDIFVSTNFYFNFFNETSFVFFKTKRKSSFFLPATTTNQPGLRVYALRQKINLFQRTFVGVPIYLKNIKFYLPICCLSIWPYKKYNYATASGSFCIKLRASKKEKLLKIILPSKIIKYFLPKTLGIIGKKKQFWRKKRIVGKAGLLRNKGKNSIVRGIAMNSVDHPHGGKANSSSPEQSPWGWITKKNK